MKLAKTETSARKDAAGKRKDWEEQNEREQNGKSALSRRMNDGRRDLLTPSVLDPDDISTIASDKKDFQSAMNGSDSSSTNKNDVAPTISAEAAARVSKIIATAGSGAAFEGQTLGVGGLDDVLVQIKRRIWTPLAAPPQLLKGTYKNNTDVCIDPSESKNVY